MSSCNVCGKEILNKSRFKPCFYCSPNCRNYVKYKNAIEKILLSLQVDLSSRSLIRGDLFRLANILSNRTNTIRKE